MIAEELVRCGVDFKSHFVGDGVASELMVEHAEMYASVHYLRGGEGLEQNGGNCVKPAIVRAQNEWDIVQEETFAPILYIIRVKDVDDAIAKHNAVPQGLSSAIFTMNMRDAERFLSDDFNLFSIKVVDCKFIVTAINIINLIMIMNISAYHIAIAKISIFDIICNNICFLNTFSSR